MPTTPTTAYRRCPRCHGPSVVREKITRLINGANGQPKNGHTRQWVHFTLRCTNPGCPYAVTTPGYYESIYSQQTIPTAPSANRSA